MHRVQSRGLYIVFNQTYNLLVVPLLTGMRSSIRAAPQKRICSVHRGRWKCRLGSLHNVCPSVDQAQDARASTRYWDWKDPKMISRIVKERQSRVRALFRCNNATSLNATSSACYKDTWVYKPFRVPLLYPSKPLERHSSILSLSPCP